MAVACISCKSPSIFIVTNKFGKQLLNVCRCCKKCLFIFDNIYLCNICVLWVIKSILYCSFLSFSQYTIYKRLMQRSLRVCVWCVLCIYVSSMLCVTVVLCIGCVCWWSCLSCCLLLQCLLLPYFQLHLLCDLGVLVTKQFLLLFYDPDLQEYCCSICLWINKIPVFKRCV